MDSMAPEYFNARDIARALQCSKRNVHRRAAVEHWPARRVYNRHEYSPPDTIAARIVAAPNVPRADSPLAVRFADLPPTSPMRDKVLAKEQCVLALLACGTQVGREAALQAVCQWAATEFPDLGCSVASLRRWRDLYARFGIDGLVEQKLGRVGPRPFAADLTQETVLRYRAQAIEHGVNGRLNVARAFQNMIADPTIEGQARHWLHGARAAKSSVPPSVRRSLLTAPLAVRHIQIGPRAAKLDGPYTECSYEAVEAGRAFTADDMTANCWVWTEWPNEQGFLVIRPQILACLDVGSLAWLNIRAIIRPRGQYNRDDVWGLVGDYLDQFGLHTTDGQTPDPIAVFEGGTWQSNVIVGEKTGLGDEARFAGLRSLGVKLIHARTPRAKVIEQAFNSLQYAADTVPGFTGREARHDEPEAVRKQVAAVAAGHNHPREFFLSLPEYTRHISGVMQQLNTERNDGKILRGRAPADKWAEDKPRFLAFPDNAKWLYRSAYRVGQVTRNGVRINVGSGKYASSYTYTHPALECHRGRRVVTFWNDQDPDTDAVVFTIRDGQADKQICVASRLPSLPRFGATDEQMRAEAARKKLAAQLCVAESRSLGPHLQRRTAYREALGAGDGTPGPAIARVRAAAEQQAERKAKAARLRARLRATDLDELVPESRRAVAAEEPFAVSIDELKQL